MHREARWKGPVLDMPQVDDLAQFLRKYLKRAGVERGELFADDETRKNVGFYDLRASGAKNKRSGEERGGSRKRVGGCVVSEKKRALHPCAERSKADGRGSLSTARGLGEPVWMERDRERAS